MSGLPKGWVEARLDCLAVINPGKLDGVGPEDKVSFVPMPAVSDVDGEITAATTRPFAEVCKGYTQFQKGDVIFAKITPCMENGKIAVARSLENGVACGSTEFHVVRPLSGISADYLWRFLRQTSFRADAEGSMTGAVGQRRVPAAYLKDSHLPLPPLPEQRRIVAKIDSLAAKSRRARDHLDHIPRLVEKYKQAILAAAFRGELTREWRGRQKGRAPYRAVHLADILVDIRYGTAKKCAYGGGTTPVLRIPNVQAGRVHLDDLKSTNLEQSELQKLRLQAGDLLMIRSNGSVGLVGRCAIVERSAEGMAYAGYLIRLRFNREAAEPAYVHLWLQSASMRSTIEGLAKSTSGVNNINSTQIEQLPITTTALEEQREIVRRIETAFAWIDRLAAEASSARTLIDRLDQAVLAKAFRGELVPQDPSDEPASVLLERIRAERDAAPKAKTRRGRKPAAEA